VIVFLNVGNFGITILIVTFVAVQRAVHQQGQQG
jgi:hypothetical protein